MIKKWKKNKIKLSGKIIIIIIIFDRKIIREIMFRKNTGLYSNLVRYIYCNTFESSPGIFFLTLIIIILIGNY